jgi:hypothetical protein
MSEPAFLDHRGSRRRRSGSDSPLPGPLCFWRYLLGWCIVSAVWLAVVYVKAVIWKQPAKYGTSLVYLGLAYGFGAWLAESAYVSWKESRGTATHGDDAESGTKVGLLLLVVVGGTCLTLGITLGLIWRAGVWTPQGGMVKPDEPAPQQPNPGANGAPAAPEALPAEVAFDPTDPRPLPAVPLAATRFPGLLAYWSFDEGRGDRAADGGPDRLDAALRGCRWVPGVRGTAVWVRGPDEAVELGGGPELNFGPNRPFTFVGWVRTASDGIVLSMRDSRDGGAVIMVSVENRRLAFLIREDRGEWGFPAQVAGPVVTDGEWHHFAAARTAGNEIELVVDGVSAGRVGTGQSGGPITTDLRFVGREEYRIRVNYPAATTWNGVLDELAVFGRKLSADEAAALAGRG